jgi:hypothetical protein
MRNSLSVALNKVTVSALQMQAQLTATLDVGQDTISRLEKRSDMLLSTLRYYMESMRGKLEHLRGRRGPDRGIFGEGTVVIIETIWRSS